MKDKKVIILIIAIIGILLIVAGTLIGVINNKTSRADLENKNQLASRPVVQNEISQVPSIQNNTENEITQTPVVSDKQTEGVTIVPTMNDAIVTDSSWCGTFQLVWNDMKNEVVKQDVVFNPQLEMVKNLNKEDFNTSMLSDEYYYKIYGLKSLKLKEEIEKGIKEKFNQTSDILEDFDWSEEGLNDPNNPDVNRYFFYTMLYRNFEFLKAFDNLDKGKFANKYNNVEYFGIDNRTNGSVGKQIKVLYYNSKDDFAIKI